MSFSNPHSTFPLNVHHIPYRTFLTPHVFWLPSQHLRRRVKKRKKGRISHQTRRFHDPSTTCTKTPTPLPNIPEAAMKGSRRGHWAVSLLYHNEDRGVYYLAMQRPRSLALNTQHIGPALCRSLWLFDGLWGTFDVLSVRSSLSLHRGRNALFEKRTFWREKKSIWLCSPRPWFRKWQWTMSLLVGSSFHRDDVECLCIFNIEVCMYFKSSITIQLL